MNAAYEEQEQLEELRRWWEKYGQPVVAGGLIGLVALLGYQWYESRQDEQAAAASNLYQELAAASDTAAADTLRESLNAQYPGTPYSTLVLLGQSAQAVADGDPDNAKALQQQALANAGDAKLRELARLGLARSELAAGAPEAALAVAAQRDQALYPALFQELIGDAHAALGDVTAARLAYQAAIDAENTPPQLTAMLQLKVDSLEPAP